MIVSNTSYIDADLAYKTLYKTSKKSLANKFLFAILMLILGIPLIIMGLTLNQSLYTMVGSMFSAFGVAYIIVNVINLIKLPKKIKKSNEEVCQNGITYLYKFKEQSIHIECKSNNKTSKADYSYNNLKKVNEYEDLYEFVFSSNEVMYILKSGFENKKMIDFFIKNLTLNKKKIKNKIK